MGKIIKLGKRKKLAYAENLYQNPAFLYPLLGNKDSLALHRFKVVSGEPAFITYADDHNILQVLCRAAMAFSAFKRKVPFIAVVGKHGNPCGVGVDQENPVAAVRKALMGDKIAVMGGELITNFYITDEIGQEIYEPQAINDSIIKADLGEKGKWGLDLIAAPGFSEGTIELLGKKEKRRLLENSSLYKPSLPKEKIEFRPVRGGVLVQGAANFILTLDKILFPGTPLVEKIFLNADGMFEDMIIACAVCYSASSNTVVLVKNRMLIGIGCGQQDRIACVQLCLTRAARAGHDVTGSVGASDAFFPYAHSTLPPIEEVESVIASMINLTANSTRDLLKQLSKKIQLINGLDRREGPELLIDAGCRGIVVPYDGIRKEEVKKLFEDNGVSAAFLPREYRGFAKH